MTYKGFTFKYFRGEEKNPFIGKDENASMWWSGEKLFYDSISRKDGDEFIERITGWYEAALTNNDTPDIHRDKSMSKRNHILLYYLDMWHGKWFPNDDWKAIMGY